MSEGAVEVRVGERVRLSPLIERVTQDNPGPFTGPGTNTHLVGKRSLFVLDPGEDHPAHLRALVSAIGDREVLAVIPSHAHLDHWPLARKLAERYRAPVLGFASRGDFVPDRQIANGERLEGPDCSLVALHTPGHASDHLCFLLEQERALFSGDHIMGWSTTIIAPPDGQLNQFMESLGRLLRLELDVLYPAHGPAITAPYERLREIHQHRLQRTRQALAALSQSADTPSGLVKRIYTDVDPKMHPAARMSLLAHLEALMEEGRVERQGEDPMSALYRLRS